MCIKYADIDLSSNIVILEGDNGQGKSAVMEAIAICLAERKRADSVKEFVQKGFDHGKIILNMAYNGQSIVFNVTLNVRGGTPFERDVEYNNKHYINSEVTDLLKELDFTFYSDIILSMQGQDDIATMTPVQRANLLQKLFQFDFTEKLKSVNDKIDEANDTIKINNSKTEYLIKELDAKKTRKDSIKLKQLPFDVNVYYEKQKTQDDMFSRLSSIKNALNELNVQYEKRNGIVNKITTVSGEIYKLEQKKAEAKRSKAALENLNFDSRKGAAAKEIEKLADEMTSIADDIALCNNEIQALNNESSKLQQDVATFKYKRTDFTKKLDLINKGVCPECGQSTCNLDHTSIDADNKTNEDLILKCQNRIDELKTLHNEKTKKLEELNAAHRTTMTDKVAAEVNLTTLEKQNSDYVSSIMPADEYAKLKADLNEFNNQKDLLNKELDDINSVIESHKDVLTEQNQIEEQYNALKDDIKSFDDVMIFNNAAQKQIEQYEDDINNSEHNIEELKKASASLSKTIDCYNEVKTIIGKELPNFLIVKTCYKLEQEMNIFVQEVFPEFKIRLLQSKRGVEFFYTVDPDNDMNDIKSLINSKMASGYERSVLGIAFKVALCRAYGLTFAALDEIDSAASDDNSMKTFQSLINSNVFQQMIFITHKEPTKEMIKSLADDVTCYHVDNGVFTNENIEN